MSLELPSDLQDRDSFARMLLDVFGQEGAESVVSTLGSTSNSATYWWNPLKSDGDRFAKDEPLPGLNQVYVSHDRDALTHSAEAESGQIYIQNPSSKLAADCLGVEPDMEVLDLAAAPGGKTIALAAHMANTGRIAAVEPVPRRFHRLKANLDRCGVSNVAFYQRDGRGVGRAVPDRFDRVLLDAPCSSESRMRWHDARSYDHWQLRKIKEAQRKQKGLIQSAYLALKPGGRLLYCTCSFSVEENEAVVAHLLKRTNAQLLPLELDLPHAKSGLTKYRNRSLNTQLEKTKRIVPTQLWDGFYLALVTKPLSDR